MPALDNEKRILNILNRTYNLDIKKSSSADIINDLKISVDFIWELKNIRILFEVDSYNAAKNIFGQYVLLNNALEYKQNCILIVIHCYKNYNKKRTEKYLNFAKETLKCKIPFLVFNELEWTNFLTSTGKQKFINSINKLIP